MQNVGTNSMLYTNLNDVQSYKSVEYLTGHLFDGQS